MEINPSDTLIIDEQKFLYWLKSVIKLYLSTFLFLKFIIINVIMSIFLLNQIVIKFL